MLENLLPGTATEARAGIIHTQANEYTEQVLPGHTEHYSPLSHRPSCILKWLEAPWMPSCFLHVLCNSKKSTAMLAALWDVAIKLNTRIKMPIDCQCYMLMSARVRQSCCPLGTVYVNESFRYWYCWHMKTSTSCSGLMRGLKSLGSSSWEALHLILMSLINFTLRVHLGIIKVRANFQTCFQRAATMSERFIHRKTKAGNNSFHESRILFPAAAAAALFQTPLQGFFCGVIRNMVGCVWRFTTLILKMMK